VALRWIASDSIENNLIADATRDRSEGPAQKLISSTNTQVTAGGRLVPNGGAQFITGDRSYTTYATFVQPGFTDPVVLNGKPGAGTHGALALTPIDPIDAWGVSDNLTWKIADHYTLTSITGYRRYSGVYSIQVGGSPFPAQLLDDTWSHRQFTEEVRLNGTSFEKLDWTLGGYYYDQLAYFGGLKLLNPGAQTVNAAGVVTASNETLFTGSDPIPSKSKSGFVHGVYRLTDPLSLIAGVRYTKEDKTYTFQRLNPYGTGPSYNPVGALDGSSKTYSGSRVDYRAGIEYQWTDSLMTYAQWSTGFRGGGVNPRPFTVAQETTFKPETEQASEIGLKSDFFEHHVRVNAAAFYNQYNDIVFVNTFSATGAPNSTPLNVGKAHIYGAELEIEARPFGGLQIDASAGYQKFKLTQLNQGVGVLIPNVSLSTNEPYAPDRQANIGVQYVFQLGTAGSITPRIDGNYQSQFFTDIQNQPLGLVAGRTLMNGRITWKSASLEWETVAGATNLTNKFYYVNKVFGAVPTNITEGQPGAPREWFVTLRRNF